MVCECNTWVQQIINSFPQVKSETVANVSTITVKTTLNKKKTKKQNLTKGPVVLNKAK